MSKKHQTHAVKNNPGLLNQPSMSKPPAGTLLYEVHMYRGPKWIGSFRCWNQATLDEALRAKVYGLEPPISKEWDHASIMVATAGREIYGWTGLGYTPKRDQILSRQGFDFVTNSIETARTSRHGDRKLRTGTTCPPGHHGGRMRTHR